MKTIGMALLMGALAVHVAAAEIDEPEASTPAPVSIQAQPFPGAGVSSPTEGELLKPGNAVFCSFHFPTNQMHTFILIARGEAEPWPTMEVRLNTNRVYAASVTSSNWASYTFMYRAPPGGQRLEILNPLTAGAAPSMLHLASVMVLGPAEALTNAAPSAPAAHAAAPVAVTNPPPAAAETPKPAAVPRPSSDLDAPVGR